MWQRLGVIPASALILAACGGSDDEGGQPGATIACAPDTMRLKGKIEETQVDRTEPISGSGLTQLGEGHFDSMYVGRDLINDPTRSWLVLDWPAGIAHGERSNASGTLVLPSGEKMAGETLCAGAGTFVGFGDDGMFYFGLRSLATGTDCSAALAGSLDGCWNNPH
jgi:hypothetical protein